MKLRTRIVVPLVLVLTLLGTTAVAAVVHVGQAGALAQARDDLGDRTLLLAEDVGQAAQARADAVALLAFGKSQTDFTTSVLNVPPAERDAARAQLAARFRDASERFLERVAIVGADGREAAAYEHGAEARPDPGDRSASAEFARFRADPLAPPSLSVGPGSRLVAAAGLVDPDGAFGGLVRGEVPLAALGPASVPGLRAAKAELTEVADPSPRAEAAGDHLRAVAPVPSLGPRWAVVTAMPASAATGPVLQPVYLLALALLGVVLTAAAVVAFVVRRSLTPLERLADAVQAVGAGPPAARVEPEGATELRGLARAFNAMVDRLQEREASLAREFATRAEHAKFATLGSLSASVAHEVKNPLTGMKLQTDLVRVQAQRGKTAAVAEAAKRLVEVNQRGIERIEKVVQSLSMLARPHPEVEAVDLRRVAEASVALAGADLRGRADVHLDIPEGLTARGTADGLGQVLLNLVGNAADAAPREGGWIRIAAERDGERVQVRVEDNGPGIAPEVAQRIGEPFFTTKETGTGLGLSISNRIVQELGGVLRFENRAEGGARFILDLRAAVPS